MNRKVMRGAPFIALLCLRDTLSVGERFSTGARVKKIYLVLPKVVREAINNRVLGYAQCMLATTNALGDTIGPLRRGYKPQSGDRRVYTRFV